MAWATIALSMLGFYNYSDENNIKDGGLCCLLANCVNIPKMIKLDVGANLLKHEWIPFLL